jgi:aminoglycoside phosphotransferase (APT) family kinase protein
VSEPSLATAAVDPDAREVVAALSRMAIVGADQPVRLTALEGGVSSAIYRADLPSGVVCVKRALARLRVAAEWKAPVERSHYEAEWLRVARAIVPANVPVLLGEDPEGGSLALEWLDPADYPNWKAELRDGRVSGATAAAVGDALGRIHAATADRAEVAGRFPTDAIFEAIRIEPYLLATARVHADLARQLEALAATTRATRRVLVHGDFSPKNILVGARGPVIVDAECAWFGEPAFDLAFVLNHLLLKAAWRPAFAERYARAFGDLRRAYLVHVAWEAADAVDARAAALLPALMLARIDGKSPVEYLVDEAPRERVRRFARAQLSAPAHDTMALASAWFGAAA